MPDAPITPDETRSASASIAGYAYQIWYSLLVFLGLKEDEAIVLEGANVAAKTYPVFTEIGNFLRSRRD